MIKALILAALPVLPCLAAAADVQADSMRSEPGHASLAADRACSGDQLASPAGCQLGWGELGFTLQASASGSLNRLLIQPAGLSVDNSTINADLDGSAYGAVLADLDGNGWPGIYVYVSSAGSGSYGSLAAYAVNNGKSITPRIPATLDQSPQALDGYMGHDRFAVAGDYLVRRFPVYRPGDSNAAPTGGTRELRYRLVPGEAGWVLLLLP